jgi:hypothetical protein
MKFKYSGDKERNTDRSYITIQKENHVRNTLKVRLIMVCANGETIK